MIAEDHVPPGIDADRPNAARLYDYYLGGVHNFAVDRRVAEQALAVYPQGALIAQANRAFLRRAVRYLVDAGVRQFLDVGSGIPTVGHVHEIAQATAPDARVVYVDIDPLAVSHSAEILAGNKGAVAIREDVRRPEAILEHPEIRRLLDFNQPVAVLVVALFHFFPDADDPADLVTRLTAPLVAGSHLVVSHGTDDGTLDMSPAREIYRRAGLVLRWRTRRQIAALFSGWDVVEPGLVWLPCWRPEHPEDVGDAPESSGFYAAVGRKR